ncbi:MAG: hypothetical protein JXB45_03070 [Candidatus Krumholzibacteriota bacterium]|nr:hypothetical protein [Candidatus Krumholzibacteriota bacterium]
MRILFSLVLLVVIMIAPLGVQGENIRETRPTMVYGELGGRGILYSVNFERYLTPNFGIGAGGMGFGNDEGAVGLFPLFVSIIPVGDIHSLYLSAGTTAAAGSANWDEIESVWLGTFSAGYQFQSESGIMVRATLNMIYKGENWLIIPGVAVGGSF